MRTNRWITALSDDVGASALVVAVFAVVLLGVAALVIDVGMLYAERRSMQTAADAAALAGVQELPANPADARTVADSYVSANPAGAQASDRTFTVSSTYIANDTLTVHVGQPAFALQLARFLGISSSPVGAQATAVLSSPSSYGSGVMPFGLMSSDSATGAAVFGYVFNQSYVLKQGSQDSTLGNFQLIDLPGTSDLKKVITGGGVAATIGEMIQTHPGDVAALMKTLDKYVSTDSRSFSSVVQVQPDGTAKILDYTSPHLIVVPIIWVPGSPPSYSWSDLRGKSTVQILSFAWIWVESGKDGTGPNGQATISGTFIRPLTPEEAASWGPPDPFGAVGFRLSD